MKPKRLSDQKAPLGGGPAATPRPERQAEISHPEYRINIYRDWCKSCGICVAFCPRQCLSLDSEGNPVVDHAERCTGCRWCELHCPDFAICVREVVSKEPESANAD
jgi:2-oxoglutarate ferredoxin oxidoreductase subunit delta